MSVVDALPARPLRPDELTRIRETDGIRCCHKLFVVGDHADHPDVDAAQLVIFLPGGPAVGCHFDPDRREWRQVERVECDPDDGDDHLRASELIDECFRELRGDDQAYGAAVSSLSRWGDS